jgi:hypothetical protein
MPSQFAGHTTLLLMQSGWNTQAYRLHQLPQYLTRPSQLTNPVSCHCWQVQQLRQNPFDAQFAQLLGRVFEMVATPAASNTGSSAAQELLSLDLVGALQGRLVCLDPRTLSSGASSGAAGSSQGSQVGCSPADNALDTFCAIATEIMAVFSGLLNRAVEDRLKSPGGDVLVLEKLLCSPAALRVAVQRLLSAEVQEAARAGSTAARECMGAVRVLLRGAAFTLYLHTGLSDPDAGGRGQELSKRLALFLGAEENLPFLEPLCLPLDHSSKPLTVLCTLCEKVASC